MKDNLFEKMEELSRKKPNELTEEERDWVLLHWKAVKELVIKLNIKGD